MFKYLYIYIYLFLLKHSTACKFTAALHEQVYFNAQCLSSMCTQRHRHPTCSFAVQYICLSHTHQETAA